MVERIAFDKFIGVHLGSYRLEKLVEQNKLGPVFLASSKTGTSYIIRFIGATPAESDVTPDARLVFLGRFQQEANQVAALQHPHILPLLDYGNYHGLPYLVYPHVMLISLRALIVKNGALDAISVGQYLEQIVSALEYAHEQAVLHRNLSTNCIYMQNNQQLVIAEFGLMRMLELSKQELQGAQPEIIQGYTYEGSSESSAPEQLLGKPVDAYTDVYALGTVLYRLLAGRPPFAGKTREEIARQHIYASVPALSLYRAGLPVDLDHILAKAMAKDPVQRFRHPSALAQAYRQIIMPNMMSSMPLAAVPAVSSSMKALQREAPAIKAAKQRPIVRTRQQRRVSRRRAIALLAAGGGVGTVAAGAFFGLRLLGGGLFTMPGANKGATKPVVASGGQNVPAQKMTILARTVDVPVNSVKQFPIANQRNPGLLIHLSNQQFVAFDSTCTHAGCAVSYNPQNGLLRCPCHDAVFDPAHNGAVVQGPTQTPLAPIKIMVNANGTITTG